MFDVLLQGLTNRTTSISSSRVSVRTVCRMNLSSAGKEASPVINAIKLLAAVVDNTDVPIDPSSTACRPTVHHLKENIQAERS